MFNGGCWIFLSHYSRDIDKIRLIRNEFERLGHNPLAFHLKCLNADTTEGKKELDSLIKREIDARDWFVFCEHAGINSEWVDMEKTYIIEQGKKFVWKIDMTSDINTILEKVRKICLDVEVFISYSHCDRETIKPLIKKLSDRDYSVWTPEKIRPGDLWVDQISNAIKSCSYKGFFLIVVSEKSINSPYCKSEFEFALSQGARIVPIIIDNPKIPDDICFWLKEYRTISVNSTEENFDCVVDLLDSMLKKEIINSN